MRRLPKRISADGKWQSLSGFGKKALIAVYSIPRGEVRTYSQIAKMAGNKKAVRAAANAVAKNPFAPTIPCHRVVRKDGGIGGYSAKGGIAKKIAMLKKEGQKIRDKKTMKKLLL